MSRVTYRVIDRPMPAGSKRAMPRKGGGALVIDANPNVGPWKAMVQDAALKAMSAAALEVFKGPVGMAVIFYLHRPASHYGSGRNAGVLKDSAPVYPTVKPDATKLLRGLEDAMTGVVYRDDSQVVEQAVSKRYGEPEGAQVIVWEL
jgi:Holliday junction resolvase RusA-like endonuclease